MKISALPAFSDHCIWMLPDDPQATVVDPGGAAPLPAALDARGLAQAPILVKHHPPDHAGGLDGSDPATRMGLNFDAINASARTAGLIAILHWPAEGALLTRAQQQCAADTSEPVVLVAPREWKNSFR